MDCKVAPELLWDQKAGHSFQSFIQGNLLTGRQVGNDLGRQHSYSLQNPDVIPEISQSKGHREGHSHEIEGSQAPQRLHASNWQQTFN